MMDRFQSIPCTRPRRLCNSPDPKPFQALPKKAPRYHVSQRFWRRSSLWRILTTLKLGLLSKILLRQSLICALPSPRGAHTPLHRLLRRRWLGTCSSFSILTRAAMCSRAPRRHQCGWTSLPHCHLLLTGLALPLASGGGTAFFTIEAPPLPGFVYPFDYSVPLAPASKQVAWLETSIEVIFAAVRAAAASPVRVYASGQHLDASNR